MITKLEDFKAHTLAMQLGEEVWDVNSIGDVNEPFTPYPSTDA